MLSSIILSLVMTTSPALITESNTLSIEEVGRKRGDRVTFKSLNVEKTGRKRGDRVSFKVLKVEKTGRKRGDRV